MKKFFILIILLFIAVCFSVAKAERVFVRSYYGEEGHAWLFGTDGEKGVECWLAVPLHVITGNEKVARSFTFTDKSGSSGQSSTPIPIGAVQGAVDAAEGLTDLAFARVEIGREVGNCLSRLGLPKYSYESVIRASPELIIFNMLPTSYGIFNVVINRAGTKSKGGLIDLKPISKADIKHIKKGISGSVAEIRKGEEVLPFAMVLKADAVGGTLRAIRFDLIKAAFIKVKSEHTKQDQEKVLLSEGISYKINEFMGTSIDPNIGPKSLRRSNECWNIEPQKGQNYISITIELNNAQDNLSGLILYQSSGCGDFPQQFFVEQRIPQVTDWVTAGTCMTASLGDDVSVCKVDLRGPRQLRIKFITLKPIGLSRLLLY